MDIKQRLQAHRGKRLYTLGGFPRAYPNSVSSDGRALYVELSQLSGLREMGESHDVAPRAVNGRGWYRDSHLSETYTGFIWRLPARNKIEHFIAGFKDEAAGGATIEANAVYECEREAAMAADELARIHAEREREYDEKWSEANQQDAEREDARAGLRLARARASESLRAWRAARGIADADLCALLSRTYHAQRDAMRDAIDTITRAGEKIDELGMTDSFPA